MGAESVHRGPRARGAALVAVLLVACLGGSLAFAAVQGAVFTASTGAFGWSVAGTPQVVVDLGPPGTPDAAGAMRPFVLEAPNGTLLMYYTGSDGVTNRIMLAFSSDGVHWTKYGMVLAFLGGAAAPFVMIRGSEYLMWFMGLSYGGPLGYTDRIYEATSSDGIAWSVVGLAVGLGAQGAWDEATVADPTVASLPNGTYRMYFTGYEANQSTAIGLATSADLVNWTEDPLNPVLSRGPAGSWESAGCSNPSVATGSDWTLFYEGCAKGIYQVGIATSSDGLHWTRSASPFLPNGAPGTWDDIEIGSPDYFHGAVGARLYCDGYNGTNSRIGMVSLAYAGPSSGGGGFLPSALDLVVFVALVVVAVVARGRPLR